MLIERSTARQFEKVLTQVRILEGCWQWDGYVSPSGYSQYSYYVPGIGTRTARIHRAMYELFVGPIPDGLELDHLCANKACVNPEHLEAVTHTVNIRRVPRERLAGPNSGMGRKTHCPQGHPYSGENLQVRVNGARRCLACAASDNERRNQRRRAAREEGT